LDWHKDGALKWGQFGVGLGYVLIALVGYIFAHFRMKWCIFFFGCIESLLFLVYMALGGLILVEIGSCSHLGSDFCSSTFYEADLMVTMLILSLNGLVLLMGGIFSFKMFHTLNTWQDPVSTTYDDGVGTLDDIGGM